MRVRHGASVARGETARLGAPVRPPVPAGLDTPQKPSAGALSLSVYAQRV